MSKFVSVDTLASELQWIEGFYRDNECDETVIAKSIGAMVASLSYKIGNLPDLSPDSASRLTHLIKSSSVLKADHKRELGIFHYKQNGWLSFSFHSVR